MSLHQNRKQTDTDERPGFVRGYLLYLLAAASDGVSAEFHNRIRSRNLRVPEWRVLACLDDEDGQMVTQLAVLALMEQSRLTKIIDQMEAKQLVIRRSDERDRRRVRIFLTPAGRALAENLVLEARDHERSIIEQISPEQAAMLKEVLARIVDLHGPEAASTSETPAGQTAITESGEGASGFKKKGKPS